MLYCIIAVRYEVVQLCTPNIFATPAHIMKVITVYYEFFAPKTKYFTLSKKQFANWPTALKKTSPSLMSSPGSKLLGTPAPS